MALRKLVLIFTIYGISHQILAKRAYDETRTQPVEMITNENIATDVELMQTAETTEPMQGIPTTKNDDRSESSSKDKNLHSHMPPFHDTSSGSEIMGSTPPMKILTDYGGITPANSQTLQDFSDTFPLSSESRHSDIHVLQQTSSFEFDKGSFTSRSMTVTSSPIYSFVTPTMPVDMFTIPGKTSTGMFTSTDTHTSPSGQIFSNNIQPENTFGELGSDLKQTDSTLVTAGGSFVDGVSRFSDSTNPTRLSSTSKHFGGTEITRTLPIENSMRSTAEKFPGILITTHTSKPIDMFTGQDATLITSLDFTRIDSFPSGSNKHTSGSNVDTSNVPHLHSSSKFSGNSEMNTYPHMSSGGGISSKETTISTQDLHNSMMMSSSFTTHQSKDVHDSTLDLISGGVFESDPHVAFSGHWKTESDSTNKRTENEDVTKPSFQLGQESNKPFEPSSTREYGSGMVTRPPNFHYGSSYTTESYYDRLYSTYKFVTPPPPIHTFQTGSHKSSRSMIPGNYEMNFYLSAPPSGVVSSERTLSSIPNIHDSKPLSSDTRTTASGHHVGTVFTNVFDLSSTRNNFVGQETGMGHSNFHHGSGYTSESNNDAAYKMYNSVTPPTPMGKFTGSHTFSRSVDGEYEMHSYSRVPVNGIGFSQRTLSSVSNIQDSKPLSSDKRTTASGHHVGTDFTNIFYISSTSKHFVGKKTGTGHSNFHHSSGHTSNHDAIYSMYNSVTPPTPIGQFTGPHTSSRSVHGEYGTNSYSRTPVSGGVFSERPLSSVPDIHDSKPMSSGRRTNASGHYEGTDSTNIFRLSSTNKNSVGKETGHSNFQYGSRYTTESYHDAIYRMYNSVTPPTPVSQFIGSSRSVHGEHEMNSYSRAPVSGGVFSERSLSSVSNIHDSKFMSSDRRTTAAGNHEGTDISNVFGLLSTSKNFVGIETGHSIFPHGSGYTTESNHDALYRTYNAVTPPTPVGKFTGPHMSSRSVHGEYEMKSYYRAPVSGGVFSERPLSSVSILYVSKPMSSGRRTTASGHFVGTDFTNIFDLSSTSKNFVGSETKMRHSNFQHGSVYTTESNHDALYRMYNSVTPPMGQFTRSHTSSRSVHHEYGMNSYSRVPVSGEVFSERPLSSVSNMHDSKPMASDKRTTASRHHVGTDLTNIVGLSSTSKHFVGKETGTGHSYFHKGSGYTTINNHDDAYKIYNSVSSPTPMGEFTGPHMSSRHIHGEYQINFYSRAPVSGVAFSERTLSSVPYTPYSKTLSFERTTTASGQLVGTDFTNVFGLSSTSNNFVGKETGTGHSSFHRGSGYTTVSNHVVGYKIDNSATSATPTGKFTEPHTSSSSVHGEYGMNSYSRAPVSGEVFPERTVSTVPNDSMQMSSGKKTTASGHHAGTEFTNIFGLSSPSKDSVGKATGHSNFHHGTGYTTESNDDRVYKMYNSVSPHTPLGLFTGPHSSSRSMHGEYGMNSYSRAPASGGIFPDHSSPSKHDRATTSSRNSNSYQHYGSTKAFLLSSTDRDAGETETVTLSSELYHGTDSFPGLTPSKYTVTPQKSDKSFPVGHTHPTLIYSLHTAKKSDSLTRASSGMYGEHTTPSEHGYITPPRLHSTQTTERIISGNTFENFSMPSHASGILSSSSTVAKSVPTVLNTRPNTQTGVDSTKMFETRVTSSYDKMDSSATQNTDSLLTHFSSRTPLIIDESFTVSHKHSTKPFSVNSGMNPIYHTPTFEGMHTNMIVSPTPTTPPAGYSLYRPFGTAVKGSEHIGSTSIFEVSSTSKYIDKSEEIACSDTSYNGVSVPCHTVPRNSFSSPVTCRVVCKTVCE